MCPLYLYENDCFGLTKRFGTTSKTFQTVTNFFYWRLVRNPESIIVRPISHLIKISLRYYYWMKCCSRRRPHPSWVQWGPGWQAPTWQASVSKKIPTVCLFDRELHVNLLSRIDNNEQRIPLDHRWLSAQAGCSALRRSVNTKHLCWQFLLANRIDII